MEILSTTDHGLAIMKGPVISIMTNIGSPVRLPFGIALGWLTKFLFCSRRTSVLPYIPLTRETLPRLSKHAWNILLLSSLIIIV